jgi:energy-coupling factor transport system substrate-specific component
VSAPVVPARRPAPAQVRAIVVRPRAALALGLASLVGLGAFCWPLLIDAESSLADGRDATLLFALLLPLVLVVVLAELSEGGLDAKAVAMLGLLSAVGAAVRPLGAGTAGIELVFFVLLLGGRAFGPGFGFVLGTTTLFASALITGGVGPWLPYQMLGAAWVGMLGGLLPQVRGRAELAVLAVTGAIASVLYGFLLNLSFWPFALGGGTDVSFVAGDPVVANLRRLLAFSLATSLGWDLGRAITTAVLVILAGPLLLPVLRRAARRARFDEGAGLARS